MASREEIKIIVDYALKDQHNLEIALKIGIAFDEIRKRIITDFLDALENALRGSLDNEKWTILDNLKEIVLKEGIWSSKNKGCYITKKEWQSTCLIGIESDTNGARNFFISVRKNQKEILKPTESGNLKNLLDNEYKKGSSGGPWLYYRYFDGIYRDWNNEEILIDMIFKKDETVSYFKEPILTIAKIVTPLIDKAVKSS